MVGTRRRSQSGFLRLGGIFNRMACYRVNRLRPGASKRVLVHKAVCAAGHADQFRMELKGWLHRITVIVRASAWYGWLPTFENVAEALVIHFGRAVEDVAALSETGGKVFRCFCFTCASWTGRGTAHFQMQRLYI